MYKLKSKDEEKEDNKFMRLAIAVARRGIQNGQTPFGACIVYGKNVVATTHNQVWKRTDSTAHAEIVCIRRACHVLNTIDLHQCRIYSTCEPCPMCFSACHWARIPRIIYGASIRDAASYGFREMNLKNFKIKEWLNLKVSITQGVLRNECKELFEQWGKKKISKIY